jgi:cystathionine beta-lyase/cystathionine gamma-synthase
MSELSINTQLVHAGERHDPPKGRPVATPIYTTVTYTYDSMAELTEALTGEGGDYTYSRYGNPTVAGLDEIMATIERGGACESFGSGMAAIHAALLACDLTPGSFVLASQDLYGATFGLLQSILGPFGVLTETADFNDLEHLRERAATLEPRVLVAETISNPLLKVCDIAAVAEIAHAAGARLIVDNTFASPFLCRPLDHGADFAVHSTTKFLSGHGDSMGGVVIAKDENDAVALERVKRLAGGVLSALEAHEIVRGLKTLGLRLQRQCENAAAIAERMDASPMIGKVHFPNISGDDSIVRRVLRGPFGGALVTIILSENAREAAFRFMDALRLCVRATSLGDVQTLVSHPATSSHRNFSPEQRAAIGISDGMVRISVGIEDAADLINDIEQALESR